MKNLKKNLNKLIVLIMLLSLNINVFAQVLSGYKQVNGIGGENDTNTDGGKDGVKVSKTIAETNLENYFDITLKVTTTSKVDEILKDPDLAVVLVLDISNTMNSSLINDDVLPSTDPNSRINVAKKSVKEFINKFYSYSANTNATRQIGLVTFNRDSYDNFNGLKNIKDVSESTLATKVDSITAPSDVNIRWTNMEAGLKRANDLLSTTNVTNKYVVFLTDGLPTTYTSSNYTGYNPYNIISTNRGGYTSGYFYNYEKNVAISSGTNYSEWGARKAEQVAYDMKNSGIKIYSIGVGITGQYTLDHLQNNGFSFTVDTDSRDNNYIYTGSNTYKKARYYSVLPNATKNEIYNNTDYYKRWLSEYIASDVIDSNKRSYYYDSDNKASLEAAYQEIFKKIKDSIETSSSATWVAEDPMSATGSVSNIEFVGLYDDKNALHDALDYTKTNQSDTATFTNNKISWDLKKSNYETKTVGNTTYYTYELKYRIRLENEKSNFVINKAYDTNGRTTLTYVVRNNGVLSSNKYIDFPIPSVEGYLGDLTFTKLSNYYKTPLSGAKFELTHDTTNCPCQKERKHATISTFTASSDSNGTVSFKNVPSGHIYKLKETVAPTNYELSNIEHTVNVSYGKVTLDGKKENLTIDNNIKTSNLIVKKTVKGNIESSGEFNFEIELKNGNSPITGSFKYTIGTTNGTLTFNENGKSEFKLKHNEEIIIYDLPYDVTYKITEKNTDGYQVKYCLNASTECLKSQSITEGKKVSANINKDNNVEFVNITNYVLPETGSSMGLIMMIIASISLIVPIIYITYSIMDERKEERI